MSRHTIKDEDGKDTKLFWSDSDGDWSPENHQTVYRKTEHGSEKVKDIHYSPEKGTFHKK